MLRATSGVPDMTIIGSISAAHLTNNPNPNPDQS